MLEGSRLFNRLLKRHYFLYRYWDDLKYMGKQVVTIAGKDKPRYGGMEFSRPTERDQKLIYDNLETWVDVDIKHMDPMHTTEQDWKTHPVRGLIRKKVKEGNPGTEPTEQEEQKLFNVFIKRFQHFNPYVIRAFSEGHSAEKVLSGKPDKWATLMPVIALGIIAITIIIIVLQFGR